MDKDNLWKKLLLGIILGIIIFTSFIFWGQKDKIWAIVSQLNWKIIISLSLLSLLNYFIRFWRWNFYLKALNLKVSLKDSFLIFFSGLALTVSPGKFGELIKTIFLKNKYGYPISQTTSIVFSERLSDLIGVLFLSLTGIGLIEKGIWPLILSFLIIFLIFFTFLTPGGRKISLIIGGKIPFVNKHLDKIEKLFDSTKILLNPKIQFFSLIPSILAWSAESLELYLIFKFFSLATPFYIAIFIYSFSTLIGGISMIPGGLGSSELTLVGLIIILLKINKSTAIAYSLLIRFFTLWFAVIVGGIFLIITLKNFWGEKNEN